MYLKEIREGYTLEDVAIATDATYILADDLITDVVY
jgi:acyl CoA:acetate/3-ketoacid CoA transferase beta subunit